MVCKVSYLNSTGIHHREVKGVSALANAFPSNWLMYASLNAFPANSAPIEIDLLIVMDDRIVLLELKDWNGPLKAKGDMWIHGRPQRSPVQLGAEKAHKIKGILKNQIPVVGKTYVDSRVVLTGTSTRDLLPAYPSPSGRGLDMQLSGRASDVPPESSFSSRLGAAEPHPMPTGSQNQELFDLLSRPVRMIFAEHSEREQIIAYRG